jgi:hypothetical protein
MLVSARVCFVLAIVIGLCALIARFVWSQNHPLLAIMPATWLSASGLLFLASAASSLLEIARNTGKKA